MIVAWLVGCAQTGTVTPVTEVGVATSDAPARPWRRMNVDQLAASMEAISGLEWTETIDGEDVALFDRLAGSLGKPDYLSSTYEEKVPGLLFQKFLDDAAKDVCTHWVALEGSPAAGDRRLIVNASPTDTLATDPDAIEADLAAALLTFHGRDVAPGDAALTPWRSLFAAATEADGDPLDGWRVVCVGLFTHPDFYTF